MKHYLLVSVIALSILVAGCQFLVLGNESTSTTSSTSTTTTTVASASMSSGEVASFQKIFMSSYFAERGGAPSGLSSKALTPFIERQAASSRAAVQVAKLTTTSFGSLAPLTLADYPEPAQTTKFTATLVSGTPTGTKVYDVVATTTYATGDLRLNYVEEYHVQDIGLDSAAGWNKGTSPDGKWTSADPIVKKSGSPLAWVADSNGILTQDQTARVRQVLTFTDGTTRAETIVSDSNSSDGVKFAPTAFDVAGSLDMGAAFIPASTVDPNVVYSSIVSYSVTPSTNPNFWFWQGSVPQAIVGIRYYTEAKDSAASTYTNSTVSFEKTISTLTTSGGTLAGTVSGIYVGSTYDSLAESVLRQKVVYALSGSSPTGVGAMTTNMKTRVVNITGLKDFYLTQANSEAVQLSQATSTIYKPSSNVDEILADPNANNLVFTRSQQVSPATGSLPFAVATSDVSGIGALATIYTAITEGAYSTTPPATAPAPASNLLPASGTIANFSGQQTMGTLLSATGTTVTNTMGSKGSVEAWLRMNTITDTAGIVHKGVLKDFSDECFSLQGWGNTGQVGIILDKSGTGNTYDSVLSKINLKAKTWYHVVATWDTVSSTKFIRLYINGDRSKSGNSGSPSVTAYRENTSGVLVGSQLPTSYSAAYGYFGFDGKITGVNVYATALTDQQVLDNYNLSKGNTAAW